MKWIRPTALALAALGVWGCGLGSRSYELRGQVLAVDFDRQEVLIRHDAVPGLMPAMTMPFRARDAGLLDGRRPGDLVEAEIVVRGADAYLSRLVRIGDAPIETAATDQLSANAPPLLEPGDAIPDPPFVDQDGAPRMLSDWRGQAVAMTFIYTRCPFPNFCPLMDRHFSTIQRAIAGDPTLGESVHLVSVSFDPDFDTPAVLRGHARTLDADPGLWTFLTGDRDEVDGFAKRFGVAVTRDSNDPVNMTHNLSTAVLDRDGTLVAVYRGADWTPQEVLRDLRKVVDGS
jgi:protein SCO1/2